MSHWPHSPVVCIHGLQANWDRPLGTTRRINPQVHKTTCDSEHHGQSRRNIPHIQGGSWWLVGGLRRRAPGHSYSGVPRAEPVCYPHPSVLKPGSPRDRGWQPVFLPLGLAVVGLPHPDSTFPRGWQSLVLEAPYRGPSDSGLAWGRDGPGYMGLAATTWGPKGA